MDNDIKALVDVMKELNGRVTFLQSVGGLVKEFEVSLNSFVQLLECRVDQAGIPHWMYHQSWVDKLTPAEKTAIEGSYYGETIGTFKIIGIYRAVPGVEHLIRK